MNSRALVRFQRSRHLRLDANPDALRAAFFLRRAKTKKNIAWK
jgi:hypothetical protein